MMEEIQPSKKKTVWLVVVIILLIASNTAWGLIFYSLQTSSQKTITELKIERTKLERDLASTKKNSNQQTADADTEWREIPELGVKYQITDKNKDFIYAYTVIDDVPLVTFSTVAIQKIPKEDGDTDALMNEYSVGAIYQYNNSQLDQFSVMGEDYTAYSKANPQNVKKIGQNIYILVVPTGFGASQKNVASAKATTQLTEIFKTLTTN